MDDVNPNALLISLLISAGLWAIVYYFYFGQWCPAMWFGTAPPLFILSFTSFFYKIFNALGKSNIYSPRDTEDDAEMREFYRLNPSLKPRKRNGPDDTFPRR